MSGYRHPDEVGGTGFLLVVAALWFYFMVYGMLGDFNQCDKTKYPYQSICFGKDPQTITKEKDNE